MQSMVLREKTPYPNSGEGCVIIRTFAGLLCPAGPESLKLMYF